MLLTIGAAAAGLLLAAGPGGKTMDEKEFIWFADELADGRLALTIPRSGAALADTTCAVGSLSELGYYAHQLPPDTLARLLALKRASGFQALPDPGPVQPETAGVAIGESSDGESRDTRSFPLGAIPAQLQPLVEALRAEAKEVLKHPVRALQVTGRPVSPTFETGAAVAFELTLKARGTEPLRASDPRAARGGEATGLQLELTSAIGEREVVELLGQHLDAGPGTRSRNGQLSLAPGGEVRFKVAVRLRAAPGRYTARLSYTATVPPEDYTSIEGVLRVDLGPFELRPAAKPRP